MRIRLPKTRRFRIYIYIVCVALIVVAADLIAVPIGRHISVGYDTTRITSPRRADGTPDYVKAIEDQYSAGVTSENNAGPLLLTAVGPADLPIGDVSAICERLSMPPLPADGHYFVRFENYLKQQNSAAKIDPQKAGDQIAATGRRPWKPEEHPQIAAWLKEMAHPLTLIQDGTCRPRYYLPLVLTDSSSLTYATEELGPLTRFRAVAQCLCARAMLHAGEHNFAAARNDLLTVHQLARLIVQGPSAIQFLVALRMDNDAFETERGLAADASFTPTIAHQFLVDLDALLPFPSASKVIDINERYILLGTIVAAARSGPGAALSGLQNEDPPPTSWKRFALDHIACSFNATLRHANRLLDAQASAFDAPTFADRLLKSRAAERAIDHFGSEYQDSVFHPADQLLARQCPSLGNIFVLADQHTMYHDLTRLALALGAYHAEHHAYPRTLAAVAPAYLPVIPLDLFVDKPLHYQVTPTGYILYALGRNMSDDHGHNRSYKDSANLGADDVTVLVGEFPTTRAGS